MRRRRTGSNSAIGIPSTPVRTVKGSREGCRVGLEDSTYPSRASRGVPARLLSTRSQFIEKGIDLVGGDIAPADIVDEHGGGALAHADALGELHGDLAVGAGAAGPHAQLVA